MIYMWVGDLFFILIVDNNFIINCCFLCWFIFAVAAASALLTADKANGDSDDDEKEKENYGHEKVVEKAGG